ncbi:MAG: ABC transporter permease [Polyangiaceae bacterium]|jgi:general nucleoside transport system permease protein
MSGMAGGQALAFLAQTVRMAVPYACAALGGVWSERSGVVNIALEGMLLAGGLAAVVAAHATGSAWAGVGAACAVAAAMGAVHAATFVYGRVDAIVSGIALNLIAAGGTRFVLRALYDSSSNSPGVEGFRIQSLEGGSDARLLLRTICDPTCLLTIALALFTAWLMKETRFGLRVRASGENPEAARGAGVDVRGVRMAAVALGAAICGLGGAALALDQRQFQSGMSGGRGFIALAAVIVSGWRPLPAVAACVAFAALDAAQIAAQDRAGALRDLVQMLPYVATLVVLAWIAARRRGEGGGPPAGLGKWV